MIVEVVYRLFPIPLILFVLSNLALRGRWQTQILRALAVLSSFLEVLTLAPDISVIPGLALPIVILVTYVFNFAQVTFAPWRETGFDLL